MPPTTGPTDTPLHLDADVLVVGAGPCGITVANLLGLYGVRCLAIDRSPAVLTFPRAVGVDDESLRTFQAAGIVREVLADTLQNTAIRYHTSWGRCFAQVKPSARPFGWARRNLFLQPLLEETLRRGAARFPSVDLRLGCELEDLAQDDHGVRADVRLADGRMATVRTAFVVGADGGRSTVRRQVGIELIGTTAPARWLVVDVSDDELDAPYSAVYCHPSRPVLVVPLPYRHRRFEFLLQPDEDEAAVIDPGHVMALLAPRYGETPLPTIVSARVYLHHSRVAETFQRGRVFLAGDAAHLQPPFFGQGMNSGIRDATNLAWKLAAVVKGQASPGLLGSYDEERRGHAAQMVQFATRIGAMYQPWNTVTEHMRDLAFRILHLVPGGQEYILQMKYKPMPRYRTGFVVRHPADRSLDDAIGRMFMQPMVETPERKTVRLDDAIGPWFALVGVHHDPASQLDADALAWWGSLGARFVQIVPPRSGPPPSERATEAPAARAHPRPGSLVLEDVDGAFRDWLLSHPSAEVVVLRPDRYVAAIADRAGLAAVSAQLRSLLGGAVGGDASVGAGLRSHGSPEQRKSDEPTCAP